MYLKSILNIPMPDSNMSKLKQNLPKGNSAEILEKTISFAKEIEGVQTAEDIYKYAEDNFTPKKLSLTARIAFTVFFSSLFFLGIALGVSGQVTFLTSAYITLFGLISYVMAAVTYGMYNSFLLSRREAAYVTFAYMTYHNSLVQYQNGEHIELYEIAGVDSSEFKPSQVVWELAQSKITATQNMKE